MCLKLSLPHDKTHITCHEEVRGDRNKHLLYLVPGKLNFSLKILAELVTYICTKWPIVIKMHTTQTRDYLPIVFKIVVFENDSLAHFLCEFVQWAHISLCGTWRKKLHALNNVKIPQPYLLLANIITSFFLVFSISLIIQSIFTSLACSMLKT